MKKLILAMFAVSSLAVANAQTNTVLLYGDLGFGRTNSDQGTGTGSNSTTMWNFNPGIGYQFTHHITLGLQGGYNSIKTDGPNGPLPMNPTFLQNRPFSSTWGVGAFLRCTHQLNQWFYIYGQFNVGYMGASVDRTDINAGATTTLTQSGFQSMIYPALGVNVYKGLSLNFSMGGLGYSTLSGSNGTGGTQYMDNFGFTFGRQMNIGLSKNFSCCCCHHHCEKASDGDDINVEVRRVKSDDDEDDAPKVKVKKN